MPRIIRPPLAILIALAALCGSAPAQQSQQRKTLEQLQEERIQTMEKHIGDLNKKTIELENKVAVLRKQFEAHTHPMGFGWITPKSLFKNPNQANPDFPWPIAWTSQGAPTSTKPPQFPQP